ncbi:hypothetical protein EJD97_018941 [Solanum chilense]|uniref:Uncharacterized protein n=1 Tax=Solanum chilense TaxID=4083 RepID=A0A6N2C5R6_SOLCI|nr:hypothetical protein EJD97_018941 [Solanum chilense]
MGCLFIRRLELLHDCPYLIIVGRREETKAALFHLVVVVSLEKERREGASELTCCSPSHLLLVLEAILFVGVVVGWWSSRLAISFRRWPRVAARCWKDEREAVIFFFVLVREKRREGARRG